ncbi:MAG: Jag N-terminal domain-containing protein [Desulfobacterales bacterium]|uniref:RNA-binding protein KhpB n=1 Tax=Candidatus Desulfaltia bathyphila TaxID=2841697 RepID=A0A8J6TAU1_9BACT|nr:Jag N-terminal domain-containing protein [Candidatus Desulfaltia bathyphila]MBL7194835.1 Jag N-terminal domain-containing protein [Desulfobacterales bacterium]MBL7206933.1 Jag N-terminal domain-containing protein [Desulfobacterales bacterium]
MSPSLEFKGKDVEQAVKNACEALNIPKEKLKHDVISYGSTGIFGLVGAKKAKIRVNVPEPLREVKPETVGKKQPNNIGDGDKSLTELPVRTARALDDFKADTNLENPVDFGMGVLQRIIDCITTDATISIKQDEDRTLLRVEGGNPALLIGKHGQTLEAIQYLVEKIINKHGEQRIRIQIDVESYLENRQASLQKLVGRLAEKAKQTRKPVTIGQMNAYDRRIVHLALKDDSGVRTKSIGNGYIKKLMIFPRKNSIREKVSG